MQQVLKTYEDKLRKPSVVAVRSGDTVRVHQRIKEGGKTRTQVFQGLVIRVDRPASLTARITVRRMASGVGVEKSFLLHSPLVERVDVTKRSDVRRKYLTYMRARAGKSARLAGVKFDSDSVNAPNIEQQRAASEAAVGTAENPEAEKTAPNEATLNEAPAETDAASTEDETKPVEADAAKSDQAQNNR